MFKLLRYFSIASFIAMSIVVILLTILYRQVAVRQVIEIGESKNVELALAFSNSLRPIYTPLLNLETGLNKNSLKDHPKITELHEVVKTEMKGLSVIKIKIYDKNGLTVFSNDPTQIGDDKSANSGFISALKGQVISALTHRGKIDGFEGLVFERDILSSYTPIRSRDSSTQIEGVFELYADVTPLVERIKKTQIKVVAAVTFILMSLYACLFFIVRYADQLLKKQEKHRREGEKILSELVIRDSLTGLYNRRHFETRFQEEIVRANREGTSLSLLLCDMNNFKNINDLQGHQIGDLALKAVGRTLLSSIRGSDLAFRWGGDEFMVVLPNTTRKGIRVFGERIRGGLSQLSKQENLELELSIGVAIFPEHGAQPDALVRLADRFVHRKKRGQHIAYWRR